MRDEPLLLARLRILIGLALRLQDQCLCSADIHIDLERRFAGDELPFEDRCCPVLDVFRIDGVFLLIQFDEEACIRVLALSFRVLAGQAGAASET